MELEFRKLRKDEIKVRVQSCTQWGATLLLYKDARCDMNILDETVGPMNWKRAHDRDNHNCIVSIWDGAKGEWVSKEDTGSESNTEKEKGLASDSFKRACVNWGIGRELYEVPRIFIKKGAVTLKERDHPKYQNKKIYSTYDKFRVAGIHYNEQGMVDGLAIKKIGENGNKDQTVFRLDPVIVQTLLEPENDIPETQEELLKQQQNPEVNYKESSFEDVQPVTQQENNGIIENEPVEQFKPIEMSGDDPFAKKAQQIMNNPSGSTVNNNSGPVGNNQDDEYDF